MAVAGHIIADMDKWGRICGYMGTLMVVAAAALMLPECALAWGPATHLELGIRVVENLSMLGPSAVSLLTAHPLDFYYGSIAPDIVAAKKMAHYLHHCHRWMIGLEVDDAAQGERQQSFALGYLAHLAADVVAHNYYVPYKMIVGFTERNRGHAYWEMRFDATAPDEVWDIPRHISATMHPENDELLKKVLSRQLFSFQTNKVFFNNVILMGKFKRWHGFVNRTLEAKGPALDSERVGHYKELSFRAVMATLKEREDAWPFNADPTGAESLKAAEAIGAELRRKLRRGALSRDDFTDVLKKYRPHLEASIYAEPDAEELIHTASSLLK